jgi:hypothetical protein
MIPTILGFPLWKGKIKRRVAKKYLSKFKQTWMLKADHLSRLGIGDFVNNCSGFNDLILKMRPQYVACGGGQVIIDVDLMTENTGCSLCCCGIEPKLSREVVEQRLVDHYRKWTLGEYGKLWFGEGSPDYVKAVEHANLIISTIEAGQHVTNEDGQLLDEYKRK